MKVKVTKLVDKPLLAGVVQLAAVEVGPASAALVTECKELAARLLEAAGPAAEVSLVLSEERRSAVRRMLKGGGFSPTGRNRPAHELLLNLLLEQRGFSHISAPVDVNNYLSLDNMLPISLLDSDKVGMEVTLRWGLPGESFVFNASGHELDLKHCLVACDEQGVPLGSPIKDSMAGKVFQGAGGLLAIIYGTTELLDAELMIALAGRMADLLQRECGGEILQAGLAS